MAKGLEKHQQRYSALTQFGKDLARRCRSHCEMCNANGVSLQIFEIEPVPNDPDFEHCMMICEHCEAQLKLKPKAKLDTMHWRHCLGKAMWSEIIPVKVTAVQLLQKMSGEQEWANELLEEVYLEPEIEEWLVRASKV